MSLRKTIAIVNSSLSDYPPRAYIRSLFSKLGALDFLYRGDLNEGEACLRETELGSFELEYKKNDRLKRMTNQEVFRNDTDDFPAGFRFKYTRYNETTQQYEDDYISLKRETIVPLLFRHLKEMDPEDDAPALSQETLRVFPSPKLSDLKKGEVLLSPDKKTLLFRDLNDNKDCLKISTCFDDGVKMAFVVIGCNRIELGDFDMDGEWPSAFKLSSQVEKDFLFSGEDVDNSWLDHCFSCFKRSSHYP
ncbi:hypothetical protein DID77_03215 [Candidatus Marinamargulisbacteria bacterium SCGC AG-439-L15]|nr:hypothetical protein DID77_03215 [Candidatus Marinamargulisbacteria bacterium SCGC AG-439-L15]